MDTEEKIATRKQEYWHLSTIAALIILADQITKFFARDLLDLHIPVEEVACPEFVDLIEMDDKEYVILLPLEDEESGEVVILKVETEGEEETYVSIDDEEEGNKVFELFKEKYKDEFEFED